MFGEEEEDEVEEEKEVKTIGNESVVERNSLVGSYDSRLSLFYAGFWFWSSGGGDGDGEGGGKVKKNVLKRSTKGDQK